MARTGRIGEFELIARYFAPLANGFEGAGGLESDNAFLPADPHTISWSRPTRSYRASISSPTRSPGSSPQRRCASACPISRRAGRRRTPISSRCRFRSGWTERWVAAFARGLAADQRRYGIVLCGGDTAGTPGPPTVTITAFGRVARGSGLSARRRTGGRRAVGERHDRRRRARPAGCAWTVARCGAREAFQTTATAHDAGSTPGRHCNRNGRRFRRPAGRRRPHCRRLAACHRDQARAVCRFRQERGARSPRSRNCGPMCWAAATTMNS